MQHVFGWTGRPGTAIPTIVWYKMGVVISGPSGEVKVSDNKFIPNSKAIFVMIGQYFKDLIFMTFCTVTHFGPYIKSV
jgi:hypothetical protein